MLSLAVLALFANRILAFPSPPTHCPPLHRGNFTLHQYQLYPENADWDEHRCVVWFGVLWNASVAVYDPYIDQITEILEYPGITRTGTEHIGGVAWDRYTNLITILVDSAAPWATAGADVSGDNLLMKYNPDTKQTLWTTNLTAITQGRYGGFQDVETDPRGNTYVVGTWPSFIIKVDPAGHGTVWYLPLPINTTHAGYGGLAALGDLLLANDVTSGEIYRMDMRDGQAHPILVPMHPHHPVPSEGDAIYFPPKYGGEVLLVANHFSGVSVLRSKDKQWRTAEFLGLINNPPNDPLLDGAAITAMVQMGSNSEYIVDDYLGDPWVPGQTAGNRTLFPFPDITLQIEALLACS